MKIFKPKHTRAKIKGALSKINKEYSKIKETTTRPEITYMSCRISHILQDKFII